MAGTRQTRLESTDWTVGARVAMRHMTDGHLGLRRGVIVRVTKTLVIVEWNTTVGVERFRKSDGYSPGSRYPTLEQSWALRLLPGAPGESHR